MEYIVLGKDNEEYGPVDQETLLKWVEHGRVLKDSKIRNSLMKQWHEAGKLDFLEEAFSVQEVHEEEEASTPTGLLKGFLGLKPKKHEVKKPQGKQATAFVQKYTPAPATVYQRIATFATDAILLSLVALILFFTMVITTNTWVEVKSDRFGKIEKEVTEELDKVAFDVDSNSEVVRIEEDAGVKGDVEAVAEDVDSAISKEEEEEEKEATVVVFPPAKKMHSTFKFFFAIFIIITLLYYGISLGVYAQTYGMHYWGIFIVKGYNDEAFSTRTFAFALLSLFFAPLTPIIVFVNPAHRSIHGYITGTRLVKITATSKV
jgi:hypothetical protein